MSCLCDWLCEAARVWSLDSRILDHAPNDLATLAADLHSLRAIAFNGGKSAAIGTKALAGLSENIALVTLPSSSAAHAVPLSNQALEWWGPRALPALI